jgi:hypothetical protein
MVHPVIESVVERYLPKAPHAKPPVNGAASHKELSEAYSGTA